MTTLVAVSDIEDKRSGSVNLEGIVSGQLDDSVDVNVFEFRQDWTWVPRDRLMWSFGANLKHLDARYLHQSDRTIDPVFVGISGGPVERTLNTDITVVCERPRLAPHVRAMRTAIAGILEIDADRVSVKATTTERLGFCGRGEGIAALAVALIQRG